MRVLIIYFVICVGSLASCSTPQKSTHFYQETALEKFFKSCENDVAHAASVISEQELIKSLTHLNRMNTGGRHYYPLEREAITKMINSLATYSYSECILVNRAKRIIYTMYDDDIFSKHIASFKDSPYDHLFAKSIEGKSAIFDITNFPPTTGKSQVFFSLPVVHEGIVQGVLIASVDTKLISNIIAPMSNIINKDGIYKLHFNKNKLYTEDTDYRTKEKIYHNSSFSIKTTKGTLTYYPFTYKDISWYIISKP